MIMSAIYNGDISPAEQAVPKDPEYRILSQKISKTIKELEALLSPDQMAMVNDLHTSISTLYAYDCEEKFKYGLAMGIQLMQAVNEFPIHGME